MRATFATAATLVAVVSASPVITKTEIVDVYTTVFANEVAAPATTAEAQGWGRFGNWHWNPVTTTTTPPVKVESKAAKASAAPKASVASSESSSEKNPTSSDYQEAVIAHHNAHRANHSAPALTWSAELASIAQQIGESCVYAHDTKTGGGGYGQNIAAGAPASNVSSVITELFYNNEVENYNGLYGQSTPSSLNSGAFDGYGHFTQIVWQGTESVGCATVDCSKSGLANTGSNVPAHFTVCNYKPAGNFLGEFDSNVLKPVGDAGISWAYT